MPKEKKCGTAAGPVNNFHRSCCLYKSKHRVEEEEVEVLIVVLVVVAVVEREKERESEKYVARYLINNLCRAISSRCHGH